LPGIIPETNSFNLLIATARFVLSMNCPQHTSNRHSDNDLICTACSPNRAGGQGVNKTKPSMTSMLPAFYEGELFTAFSNLDGRSEQVLFVTFRKNPARQKIFPGARFLW